MSKVLVFGRSGRTVGLGLLLAAMLVAPAAAAGPPAAADPPGAADIAVPVGDGRIAFVNKDNIVSIEPDGTGRDRLAGGGLNAGPAWSPDGAKIAYVHEDASGLSDLWVMNADGSGKSRVTTGGGVLPAAPSWSPDGSQLAFGGTCLPTAKAPDLCVSHDDDAVLNVVASTESYGVPQTLVNQGDGEVGVGGPMRVAGRSAWAPSGAEIAFYSTSLDHGPFDQFIALYRLADEALDLVSYTGGEGRFGTLGNPAFSRDGLFIAYDEHYWEQGPRTHVGIQLREVDGARADIFRQVEHDIQLAFAPSQKRVALVRDVDRDRIVLAANDGWDRTRLTRGSQPSWQAVPLSG